MKIIFHTLCLAFPVLFFSCKGKKPVEPLIVQTDTTIVGGMDTINVGEDVKKFYSFCSSNLVYLGADSTLLLDTIGAAIPFFVDTVRNIVYNETEGIQYYVGKYEEDGQWKKGYISIFDVTDRFYETPGKNSQVLLLGVARKDKMLTSYNFRFELRAFKDQQLFSSYLLIDEFYPFEAGIELTVFDDLVSDDHTFVNVFVLYEACGSSGSSNFLRYSNNGLENLMEYWWSAYEIVNEEELLYVHTSNMKKMVEIKDGKLTGNEYEDDIMAYSDQFPLFIKRRKSSELLNLGTATREDFRINEFIIYDLIYSYQNDQLILIDSLNYDSSKVYSYKPNWSN